jgi:hypothetical protein
MKIFYVLVFLGLTQSGQVATDGNLVFLNYPFLSAEECAENRQEVIKELSASDSAMMEHLTIVCAATGIEGE